MGVPSGWLCWLHNSGVSTPSLFSQSKNTLGLSLNHLPISFPRPNLKPIFFPFPLSLPNLHTMSYITPFRGNLDALTAMVVDLPYSQATQAQGGGTYGWQRQ